MASLPQIQEEWVEKLFENEKFKTRLELFIQCQNKNLQQSSSNKTEDQMSLLSEQISSLICNAMQKQSQQRFELLLEEINKVHEQISNIKVSAYGYSEKLDLETTNYNKSKLQFSSILEQDICTDLSTFQSSIEELQEKFNQWFGTKAISKNTTSTEPLSQSNLSKFIVKKCTETVSMVQKRQLKRIQAGEVMAQKRIEQITKTLNNVLVMLNQSNNKKVQANMQCESIQQPSQGLHRQSSLQNLKIKNFFTFGHK